MYRHSTPLTRLLSEAEAVIDNPRSTVEECSETLYDVAVYCHTDWPASWCERKQHQELLDASVASSRFMADCRDASAIATSLDKTLAMQAETTAAECLPLREVMRWLLTKIAHNKLLDIARARYTV